MSVRLSAWCCRFANRVVGISFHVSFGSFWWTIYFRIKSNFLSFSDVDWKLFRTSHSVKRYFCQNHTLCVFRVSFREKRFEKKYTSKIVSGNWAVFFPPFVQEFTGVLKTTFYLSIGTVLGERKFLHKQTIISVNIAHWAENTEASSTGFVVVFLKISRPSRKEKLVVLSNLHSTFL